MDEGLLLSDVVKGYLDVIDLAVDKYNYAFEQVGTADLETLDILHELELADMTTQERYKLSTELRNVRLRRRKYKDTVIQLEPIIEKLDNQKFKDGVNQTRQLLGELRKVEKHLGERYYVPRVRED